MVQADPAAPATFSLTRMTELAQRCQQDGEAVPVEEFCDLLDSIVLLLQGMGSLMSVAFSGRYKIARLRSRCDQILLSLLLLIYPPASEV